MDDKLVDDYLNRNQWVVRKAILRDDLSQDTIQKLIEAERANKNRKVVLDVLEKEKVVEKPPVSVSEDSSGVDEDWLALEQALDWLRDASANKDKGAIEKYEKVIENIKYRMDRR